MRTIIIALENIKKYIKNRDRYVFIVFFDTVIALVGFLYLQGYYLQYSFSHMYKTECVIGIKENTDRNNVVNLVNSIIEKEPDAYAIEVSDDENQTLVGLYTKAFNSSISGGTPYGINEKASEAIVGISTVNALEISENEPIYSHSVNVNGSDYRICSVVTMLFHNASIAIPPLVYAENYKTQKIKLCLSETKKQFIKKELYCWLNENVSVAYLDIDDVSNPLKSNNYIMSSIEAFMVLIVFLINVLIVYFFWLDKNKKILFVLRLLGAGKSKIGIMLFVQTMIVYTSSFILAFLVFAVITIFESNQQIIYTDSLAPYIEIMGLVYLGISIISVIISFSLTRKKVLYRATE